MAIYQGEMRVAGLSIQALATLEHDGLLSKEDFNKLKTLNNNLAEIKISIESLKSSMILRGKVTNYEALEAIPSPANGDVYIVENDSTKVKGQYVYSSEGWIFLATTEINVRDFDVQPINIASETTGLLDTNRLSGMIANTQVEGLSDVAKSGSYFDLTDAPGNTDSFMEMMMINKKCSTSKSFETLWDVYSKVDRNKTDELDSFSNFGDLSNSYKYVGGVLAPNGKIYCIPSSASEILCIDPSNNSISTFGNIGGNNKYWGGVLAPNGKIYCIPSSASEILCIDPSNNSISTFGNLALTTGKYVGGVLAPNGKIYCLPYNATEILCIDPETNSTSTFGNLTGTGKYTGGSLAPNGKIYCIPYNATEILCIDPETNSTSVFGNLALTTGKYTGGVLAPNGKIYCIPYNATEILCIDPETNSTSVFGNVEGTSKYWCGTLAPNGKIYCALYNATEILCIDPETNSTSVFGSFAGNSKYGGCVLAPNGKIYCIPNISTVILCIDTHQKVSWKADTYTSPHFNNL